MTAGVEGSGPRAAGRPGVRSRRFEEAARAAGHYLWFETRLFEMLGSWAETEEEPAVKLALSSHSLRHAWHATVWRERLPVVGWPNPDWSCEALAVAPSEGWGELLEALGSTGGSGQALERVVGVYRVLAPRLIASYEALLGSADPISDGPTLRWLPLVLADERDALHEGDRLLSSMLRTAPDVDRAAVAQAGVEERVVAAGPVEGH